MRLYADDELIYASTGRCQCGAGLAHANDGDPRGSWRCSKVLKEGGAEDAVAHDMPRPFIFWNIHGEFETPGRRDTTRPGGFVDRERLREVGP